MKSLEIYNKTSSRNVMNGFFCQSNNDFQWGSLVGTLLDVSRFYTTIFKPSVPASPIVFLVIIAGLCKILCCPHSLQSLFSETKSSELRAESNKVGWEVMSITFLDRYISSDFLSSDRNNFLLHAGKEFWGSTCICR